MKTTKTTFIKKAISAGAVVIMLVVSTAFVTNNNETKKDNVILFSKKDKINYAESKYYVVTAWKRLAYNETKETPIISNVVYVDCKYHSRLSVEVAFNTFYEAYYDTKGVKNIVVAVFNTRDAAISDRRETIADRRRNENDNPPVLINDLTVPCD
jgi:hypothetical protein